MNAMILFVSILHKVIFYKRVAIHSLKKLYNDLLNNDKKVDK